MKVIFVHGRAQQDKDVVALSRAWFEAANVGLSALSLSLLADADIAFPYYGDVLFKLTEDAGRKSFNDLIERGASASAPSAEEQAFFQSIVLDIARSKGISLEEVAAEAAEPVVDRGVQNWKVVLAALRLLDKIKGVGQTSIELFTRDVWYYLTMRGIRLQVDDLVSAAIPTHDQCIVVAHSLGTIVAYNVLMNRRSRENVKAFITIGSPLGIEAVYSRLPSDTKPRKAPEGVATWFNARDAQDVVALYEIDPTNYRGSPVVSNFSGVVNTSDNQHDIVEYLKDPTVSKAIAAAAT